MSDEIDASKFSDGTEVKVIPYCITKDGSKVYGIQERIYIYNGTTLELKE